MRRILGQTLQKPKTVTGSTGCHRFCGCWAWGSPEPSQLPLCRDQTLTHNSSGIDCCQKRQIFPWNHPSLVQHCHSPRGASGAQQRAATEWHTRLWAEVQPPEGHEQKTAVRTLPSLAEGGCVTGTHHLCVGRHLRHLWGSKISQEHCSEGAGSQQGELAAALAREVAPLGTGSFFFTVWKPVLCKIV